MTAVSPENAHTLEPGNTLDRVPGHGTPDCDRFPGQDGDVTDWLNERWTRDKDLLRVENRSRLVSRLTPVNAAILLTDVTNVHVTDNVSVNAACCYKYQSEKPSHVPS